MAVEWGSVASWVSGLGSFAAVVTALYLARDAQRIKLNGYCGLRLVVGGGLPQKELLFISVTNIGSRPTIINNIGMTVGRFKNKCFAIITAVKDAYSDGVPVTIGDGEVAKWGIPVGEDKRWIKDLVKDFVITEKDAETLRFVVYTTHGHDKVIKPEEPLVQEIKKAIKEKNA